MHDPRIGKFMSVDPLAPKYLWYTPYQFAGNTPIQAIDLDGIEQLIVTKLKERTAEEGGKAEIKVKMEYMVVTEGVGRSLFPN